MRYGALESDWIHFSTKLKLTADLLPVVSNPNARIMPGSSLANADGTPRMLGKIPSMYNKQRLVGGIGQWTSAKSKPNEIAHWAKEPDYGICIVTRTIRAVDVDIGDESQSAKVRDFIEARIGKLPARTRANSGKFLLVFRCAGEMPKRAIKCGELGIIEFLGEKQQFVSCGTHVSGVRYEWLDGLPQTIPELTPEQFDELWAALASTFGTEPSTTAKVSNKLDVGMAAIANDPLAQYLINKNLVKRIHPTTYMMSVECPNSGEHSMDSGDTETVYWPPNTGGFAYAGFNCQHSHCRHITNTLFKSMVGYTDDDTLVLFEEITDEPKVKVEVLDPESDFPWQSAEQFLKRPQPSWHIKHVLPKADLILLYGASGSGKSFFALDLAMAMTHKTMWRTHAVTKGRVAYVVAEGSGSFRNRVAAYAMEHQIDPATIDIVFMAAAPNLMNMEMAVKLSNSLNKIGRFHLIIIDTFAQVTPGANENAGEAMGIALLHCRVIHRMTGATVCLIHHAGKDASKGARGWSGTHAAADCVIEVIREGDDRCATVVKQKDGNDGVDYSFTLLPIVVAHDEDGEAITSCIVQYTGEARPVQQTAKDKGLGAAQRTVLRVFERLSQIYDEMPVDTFKAAAGAQFIEDDSFHKKTPAAHQKAATRAVDDMLKAGRLTVKNEHVQF